MNSTASIYWTRNVLLSAVSSLCVGDRTREPTAAPVHHQRRVFFLYNTLISRVNFVMPFAVTRPLLKRDRDPSFQTICYVNKFD